MRDLFLFHADCDDIFSQQFSFYEMLLNIVKFSLLPINLFIAYLRFFIQDARFRLKLQNKSGVYNGLIFLQDFQWSAILFSQGFWNAQISGFNPFYFVIVWIMSL